MALGDTPIYTPNPPTVKPQQEDARNLATWVTQELNNISNALNNITRLQITPVAAPPPTPREGLLAYADGVSWNPNGVGRGLREWVPNAPNWRAIGAPFGPAGPNHVMGLVPDPGAVAGPPNTFLREDSTFAQVDYASVTGTPGAITIPQLVPQGRLTIQSGVPVMSANNSAIGTIFYTPRFGLIVPIWNGSLLINVNIGGELSQLLNDTTKSPAAAVANSFYDMFVWLDGNTPRCTRGPAWTNSSTRSMALAQTSGILTNGVAITNGPAINQGTYVGTIATNGTATLDFLITVSGSGGGFASVGLWNMYNRTWVSAENFDTGASYTYTSSTVRQARASTNNQINFIIGLNEDAVMAHYMYEVQQSAAGSFFQAGPSNYNSATGFHNSVLINNPSALNNDFTAGIGALYLPPPSIGALFIAGLEASDGTHANTFDQFSSSRLEVLWSA